MVDSRDVTKTTESGDVVMEKDKDIVCEARMELLILMILMLLLALPEKYLI